MTGTDSAGHGRRGQVAQVGYITFDGSSSSVEAGWLASALKCDVRVAENAPTLNLCRLDLLPSLAKLTQAVTPFLELPWVVAEGPGGFLYTAVLRANGYRGGVTILPYVNPRQWYDVAAVSAYLAFADRRDRVFLGSRPAAAIYHALGVKALVGEPYGIDCELFFRRPGATEVLETLAIPSGRLLLFTGRAQPDKDLYRLLRIGLRARLLFSDLEIVIASHVVDEQYLQLAREQLGAERGVHLVIRPPAQQLADLYSVADVFATVATSEFETFGRAPAEALACGTPAVAPRYDGFAEVLAQPGGSLVDVAVVDGKPQVSEELMLRALYDVLSARDPVPPATIAAAARQRFCRATTIRMLAHVIAPEPGEPASDIQPAALALPPPWEQGRQSMASLSPHEVLPWLWASAEPRTEGEHDAEFVAAVRRWLCVGLQGG